MSWRRDGIQRKTLAQIDTMREAGVVVADALAAMTAAVQPGVTTLDLDGIARDILAAAGARSNFLNYDIGNGPYPAVICASVNDKIVHGIPLATEILRDGDVISIDFGAIIDGWHADAAVTVGVGSVSGAVMQMSAACERALHAGIAAARAGGRLGDISNAVQTSIEASGSYGILAGYGGHGIGTEMHQDPHIANQGRAGHGPKLEEGMCLAIEPMISLGSPRSRELPDGWTIVTADGSMSAHWEHTVAILADGPQILTAR
jgi:methionyl aminopeptidase